MACVRRMDADADPLKHRREDKQCGDLYEKGRDE
jgi:hypothetical protein